ncbi:MAG: non-heme iron oxygenase ferredoxin subunit [Candidatus Binataceae bacterium]
MALVRVCTAAELKPGEAIRVNSNPPVALFRLSDGFFATADMCTHAQASLAAGDIDLEEGTVECPYHMSQFEIRSGRVLNFPATRPVSTYVVKVVGDEVFVELGEKSSD